MIAMAKRRSPRSPKNQDLRFNIETDARMMAAGSLRSQTFPAFSPMAVRRIRPKQMPMLLLCV